MKQLFVMDVFSVDGYCKMKVYSVQPFAAVFNNISRQFRIQRNFREI